MPRSGAVPNGASAPSDGSVAGFGDQAASADGSAIAYVEYSVPGPGAVVRVLRAGDSQGRAVFRSGRAETVCAPSVAWFGHWLLFTPKGGQVVALDTSTGRTVDLSRVVRRLPGLLQRARWLD